jgi:hypothetical protein
MAWLGGLNIYMIIDILVAKIKTTDYFILVISAVYNIVVTSN